MTALIPLVSAQDLVITDSRWGIEHRTSILVRIHGHLENVGLVTHYMPMVTATLYVNNDIYAQSTTYCSAATFAPGDVCWFGFHFSNLLQEPTAYSLIVGSAL
jgi:hypothetical protein